MKQYHDLCKHVLENGIQKGDRTGTGTLSIFGYQMRFNLEDGFPLMTTKEMPFRLIAEELLWFLNGDTNIKYLVDKNVNIWNDDAYSKYKKNVPEGWVPLSKEMFIENIKEDDNFARKYGELGPVYGKQWRSWNKYEIDRTYGHYYKETIDQITNIINEIKANPNSRRLIVSAWNPAEIEDMTLPPCHTLFQFYVIDNKLYCQLYQRSGDVFLGVPFNIASYALLTMMIAKECNLGVGEFIHTLGDAHIYNNHIEQVKLQLTREPFPLPKMILNKNAKDIFNYKINDFLLANYECHEKIKGEQSS